MRTGLILLWLYAFGSSAQAAQFYALKVSHHDARYQLSAEVYLDAPMPQVYRVLTDYDHLTRISGAVRESRLLHRVDAHTALVYVESRACVLIFCHTIRETQKVVESPPDAVSADAIPAQSNVRFASSSWHLQPEGSGTRMTWNLSIEPEFWIPPLIGPALMEDELRSEGTYSAYAVEKLARQRAHLPSLNAISHVPPTPAN